MIAAAAGLGLLIGLVIGGLGGGGGVLTVPVLVYLLGQTAQAATTSSVVIVGTAAVAGLLARLRGGIDLRVGLAFGAVGIPAAVAGTWASKQVAQPVLLLVFAAVTLLAATALLIDGHRRPDAEPPGESDGVPPNAVPGGATTTVTAPSRIAMSPSTLVKVLGCGLTVGVLTGFLGVGGGFLVVPALVVALRMPIRIAIGTSLMIIALNSVASFASRLDVMAALDWGVIAPFTLAAVAGTVAGKLLCERLSGTALRRGFAGLLVLVGVAVAIENLVALAG